MLKKLMAERCFCGLDIGSETIKAAMVKMGENVSPDVLGVYETKTAGFKQSSITDLADFAECIHATLDALMKKSGVKLKEVHVGINGQWIDRKHSAAVIPLVDRGSKAITRRDVKKVQEQARLLGVKMDEVVLHDFPQYYKVDDVNIATNPVGLFGRKLEMKSLLIIINNTLLKNLTNAVHHAGYDVANISFVSLYSAIASLNEYQCRQGVILIDAGASMSEILVFKEGHLKYLSHVILGGEDISRSIAKELNLGMELSENIKRSYASALWQDSINQEEILIKRDEGYMPLKKELISKAMSPVLDQFIDAVVTALKQSECQNQMDAGIVMVGGGALLPGLAERIEQATNLPVKIGRINIINKRLPNAAKYSGAVGLAQTGQGLQMDFSGPAQGHANFITFFANKFKDLYQEYF